MAAQTQSRRRRGQRQERTVKPDFTATVTICLPSGIKPDQIRFLFGDIEPHGDKKGGRVFVAPGLTRLIVKRALKNGGRAEVVAHIRPNDERYLDTCAFFMRSVKD